MITRLARFAVRRPVAVLVGWALAVVVLAVIGRGVEDKLLPTQLLVPDTESARWDKIREGHFGEDAGVLLKGPAEEIDRQGPTLSRALARRDNTRALSPWTIEGDAEELRPSPQEALIVLDLRVPEGETPSTIITPLERFVDERVKPPLEAHLSGNAPLGRDINEATTSSIHTAERLAFPVLIIVLLLVFRTPIAAAIPLLIALGTLQSGFGVISILAEFADLDAIALSLASMIGLALGVDYSLLIVTRFREALDDGLAPRQAASLAANTAGRTAVFAGVVLIAVMLVSFFLSPGSVLLSSATGAIVVTLLSMGGAALVAPAAVTLLGHRVNSLRIGRRREGARGGGILTVVRRATARPLLAAGVVLAGLLLVAVPATAISTIPPDPRQLPEDSRGLENFNAIRDAGFGPTVDIVLETPRGTLTDERRLRQITRFERRLAEVRHVESVIGPSTLREQSKDLLNASEQIEEGEEQLEEGKRDLARLERGLRDATGGVARLRGGIGDAAAGSQELAGGAERARSGAGALAGGAERAEEGADAIAAGTARADEGTSTLEEGLGDAQRGASELSAGAGEARAGAQELEDGSATLRDGLRNDLAPGANELAVGLRQGQAQLTALRLPARVTEEKLREAAETLDSMTVGRTDPLYAQLVLQVNTALAAATGENPLPGTDAPVAPGYEGLEASIAEAAARSGEAAQGARRLEQGIRQAADGADELNDGAGELAEGLAEIEAGANELESGLTRARNEVAQSAAGLERLANGAEQLQRGLSSLGDGANQLAGGVGQIAEGNALLARELSAGFRQSAPLESGLSDATSEVATVRDQLIDERGPFRPLRSLSRLQDESPGFLDSGFIVAAALDGARALDRQASLFLIDTDHGANVGRIQVRPSVPPNDPRTEAMLADVRDLTGDFEEETGILAAAGGPAGELTDFDRVTTGRLPLLILFVSLVTYLLLVPILRALILPAIAVLLNLLTVAAGFGVLTLLFVGDDPPLGGAGALDAITVAGVFSITFALSIDYSVFVLTRMREEYVRTQSADQAIEHGIGKTGKVVTGAAAIMIAVFTAFALSDFVIVKQFGVGLAVAVLVDATIVRLVLLPAIMRLLGEGAWWMPAWLDERLPLLDVEGSQFEHEVGQYSRA